MIEVGRICIDVARDDVELGRGVILRGEQAYRWKAATAQGTSIPFSTPDRLKGYDSSETHQG